MTIAKTRRTVYQVGSILGDVQAIQQGPEAVIRRLFRKALWRFIGRTLRGRV